MRWSTAISRRRSRDFTSTAPAVVHPLARVGGGLRAHNRVTGHFGAGARLEPGEDETGEVRDRPDDVADVDGRERSDPECRDLWRTDRDDQAPCGAVAGEGQEPVLRAAVIR